MAIPTVAAIFLEINALVILVMIVCLVLHEATAIWDVRYAYETRKVSPVEQHIHSVLEILPLAALLMIVAVHWGQFLALFSFGTEAADFGVRVKEPPLPVSYIATVLTLILLFDVLPYLEELARGILHRRRARLEANSRPERAGASHDDASKQRRVRCDCLSSGPAAS
jgi:hypothetical protein